MKRKAITLGVMALGVLCVAVGAILLVQAQKEPFPSVISTSPTIEVLETQFKDRDQNRLEPSAQILLRNTSDKTIIAFTVESGNKTDVDTFSQIRIAEETGPVAGPKADFTIDIPIGNFRTESPLRLCAVVFGDGSSDGEKAAVEELKKLVEEGFRRKGRRVDPE